MRAFVAIEMPEEIKAGLLGAQKRLREARVRASWVKPEAMHLTLRFLGDISAGESERLADFLAPRFAEAEPVAMRVHGVGAFPNVRKPGVVWAGVEPWEGPLETVFGIAEAGAMAIGQKAEGRGFHPHVTLGRVRDDRRGGGRAAAEGGGRAAAEGGGRAAAKGGGRAAAEGGCPTGTRGNKDSKDSKDTERLVALIERERFAEFGAFTATSVSLFSSELTPQGPIHTRVKEFRFSCHC